MTVSDNAQKDLNEKAADRASEVLDLLSFSVWRHPLRRPKGAEKRKLLRRLHASIREVPCLSDEDGRRRAMELLKWPDGAEYPKPRLSRDVVAELVDAWDQLLITHGPSSFVCAVVATEHVRDKRKKGPTTWRDVFGTPLSSEEAEKKCAAVKAQDRDGKPVRGMLSELYSARATLYESERARTMTKASYIWALAPLLLFLIAGLAVVIKEVGNPGPSGDRILAAALAGGLGGAVSGMYKLRDQINQISQVRAFPPAMVVQVLIGAAAGLLLLLVVVSGLISPDWGGKKWAQAAVFGFAAGFSEPFFLGVVGKVADAAPDKAAPDEAAPDEREEESGGTSPT